MGPSRPVKGKFYLPHLIIFSQTEEISGFYGQIMYVYAFHISGTLTVIVFITAHFTLSFISVMNFTLYPHFLIYC
jgi:hypothetical protein